MPYQWIEGDVCAPKGFQAAGVHCGIRKNRSKKDLALIFSSTMCTAASVYTANKVKGAPILVTQQHLKDGKAQAILCNSGNANTCNADGIDIANAMCKSAAQALGIREEDVVIASTGVIGQPLPLDPITAAMPDGTGLKRFRNMYPDRFFDVGIAEEHAVTFAAGLAAGGMKPIVAVYSSFLQRAYDQILHDVCIQNLPVVFAIDRAGLVGSDGETHQGIFDYTYLSGIPNMHICAPKNKWELSDMMKFAVALEAPIAVRYPRGTAYAGLAEYRAPIELGKAEWIVREGGIALFAVGSMVKTAEEVQALLHEKGYRASIINARFIKPIDEEAVLSACEDHDMIVTMEENVLSGGFGQKVLTCLNDHDRQIRCVMAGIPDAYVEHGNVELLKKEIGLDAVSITEKILEKL